MRRLITNSDHQHADGSGPQDALRVAALLPPLVVRLASEGPDAALQRLALFGLALAIASTWAAVFAHSTERRWGWWGAAYALTFVVLLPGPVAWGAAALALSFGTVFGREVFGGHAILPPALVGLAFALFSFPDGGFEAQGLDGLAPSTVFALSCVPGAWLLFRRSALAWLVIVGAVVGAVTTALAMGDPAWWRHPVVGAFAAGVVFLAAAPESAVAGRGAQAVHGILVGALIVLIRLADPNHPDGVVFAVLLGGLFAPLLGRALHWWPSHV